MVFTSPASHFSPYFVTLSELASQKTNIMPICCSAFSKAVVTHPLRIWTKLQVHSAKNTCELLAVVFVWEALLPLPCAPTAIYACLVSVSNRLYCDDVCMSPCLPHPLTLSRRCAFLLFIFLVPSTRTTLDGRWSKFTGYVEAMRVNRWG